MPSHLIACSISGDKEKGGSDADGVCSVREGDNNTMQGGKLRPQRLRLQQRAGFHFQLYRI